MEIRVYKTEKLFNLDLRTTENVYYVNLGWVGLWIHPKLVREGKILFPIMNCDVVKIGNDIIISEGNQVLHYVTFDNRVIKDIFGLSIINYFLPPHENPKEALIVSTPGNNILLKTEQILDVNLNPIPIEIKNTIENDEEDEDY